jgi:jumonji domain-containing protein 7
MATWRRRAYLISAMQDHRVLVAQTPTGLADAVSSGKFMLPFESRMTMAEALQLVSSDSPSDIAYIQSQNNNLASDFARLDKDVPPSFAFADEAFGCTPDARNVWFGNSKSTSSLHKDPYENLYGVVAGVKIFTLIPPHECPFLYEREFAVARHSLNTATGEWTVEDQPETTVPWIPVDPTSPNYAAFPLFRHCQPVTVEVHPGDLLYLPSLWFHHVQQREEQLDGFKAAIAVNMWYDMDFDSRYAYFNFLRSLSSPSHHFNDCIQTY